MEVSPPNYAQPGLGAESGEFYIPPTSHLIATVEDLTAMLDYASEDIDGMDDDAGDKPVQDPPFTGRWMAISTYDVYMVDTPKKDDDDSKDPREDKPLRHHRNIDVSGNAQNPVAKREAISAPETITLRTMPKITKTPPSLRPSRMIGRRDKLTPMSRSGMRIRRIVTIY